MAELLEELLELEPLEAAALELEPLDTELPELMLLELELLFDTELFVLEALELEILELELLILELLLDVAALLDEEIDAALVDGAPPLLPPLPQPLNAKVMHEIKHSHRIRSINFPGANNVHICVVFLCLLFSRSYLTDG
jgi:hypothetical protein